VLGAAAAGLDAVDCSARPLLLGVDGRPTGGLVGVTGAWGILHGESDGARGKAGKLAALGGVPRKGVGVSELDLRAMGPGMGVRFAEVLISASAMMALISTLGAVEMARHPPAAASGAGVLG